MFYAYSPMIFDLSMANPLSNLILVILLFQLYFYLRFFVSPYSLKSHIRLQDKQLVLEDDYKGTTHNEVQEKYGYLQDLRFPHPRSLGGPQPQLSLPPLPNLSQTDFEPPPHHSVASLGRH